MDAVIIANGEFTPAPRLELLWREAGLRIAANGGSVHAHALGLAPHVAIGDLDSVDPATRAWLSDQQVEQLPYPPAKDKTDLELAVDLALLRGAARITLVGATGGRLDQTVANVLLLTYKPGVLFVVNGASEAWAATGEAIVDGSPGDLVSLIPVEDRVEGIVTENLEYPLNHEDLWRGSTRGVSNVMQAARAEYHWTKGLALVVHEFKSSRTDGNEARNPQRGFQALLAVHFSEW